MIPLVIKELLVKFQNKLVIIMTKRGFDKTKKFKSPLVRLGSDYGGWWVPEFLLKKSEEKGGTLISCGIGSDITFDIELQKRNFDIIALDPLLTSCIFAKFNFPSLSNVKIINKGLWTESGIVAFHSPVVEGHDSWSINNSHVNTQSELIYLNCTTLDEIINENLIDKKTVNSILKMDIEGAELEIFDSIVNLKFDFDFICIEIDSLSLIPFKQIKKRIRNIFKVRKGLRNLEIRGYSLCFLENFNFFWINKKYLSGGGGI